MLAILPDRFTPSFLSFSLSLSLSFSLSLFLSSLSLLSLSFSLFDNARCGVDGKTMAARGFLRKEMRHFLLEAITIYDDVRCSHSRRPHHDSNHHHKCNHHNKVDAGNPWVWARRPVRERTVSGGMVGWERAAPVRLGLGRRQQLSFGGVCESDSVFYGIAEMLEVWIQLCLHSRTYKLLFVVIVSFFLSYLI